MLRVCRCSRTDRRTRRQAPAVPSRFSTSTSIFCMRDRSSMMDPATTRRRGAIAQVLATTYRPDGHPVGDRNFDQRLHLLGGGRARPRRKAGGGAVRWENGRYRHRDLLRSRKPLPSPTTPVMALRALSRVAAEGGACGASELDLLAYSDGTRPSASDTVDGAINRAIPAPRMAPSVQCRGKDAPDARWGILQMRSPMISVLSAARGGGFRCCRSGARRRGGPTRPTCRRMRASGRPMAATSASSASARSRRSMRATSVKLSLAWFGDLE